MAVHWQVKFKALRSGILYTVNIYDDNYSGSTPVQLRGAAQPFSTAEDIEDDWFKPVRLQSGYLRIVDNGKDLADNAFNWKDLIPATATSRKVTLTHVENNTTIIDWQGYLQPQTFSGQMYENVQERQFPVCCALSVLESMDIDTEDVGMVNMAYLLSECISKTGMGWHAINFNGEDVMQNWLYKRVYWANFIDYDDDQNPVAKYNYLELLQEVCKFWGWTCRTFGNQLFFVSPDDDLTPDFTSIEEEELYHLANDQSYILHYTTFEWDNINTNRDIYASTNNNIEYLRGIRQAEITADIGLMEKIYDIPFNAIKDDLDKPPYPNYTQQGDHYQWLKQGLPNQSTIRKVSVDVEEDGNWTPMPFDIIQTYDGNLDYLHRWNWSCYLGFLGGQNVSQIPDQIVRIKSSMIYAFTSGMIYIKGAAKANAGGILKCKLNIGDKWWTGSDWSTTESDFELMFGNEQDMSQGGDSLPIRTNRHYNDPVPDYDGFGIQIPSGTSLCGQLTLYVSLIYLYDGTAPGEGIQALFSSLEIGFLRNIDAAPNAENGQNTYKGSTNKPFSDEVSVSMIFASDNGNNFGTGLLVNTNNSYCDGVSYSYEGGGLLDKPEEHLLDRILLHGKDVKKKETVEFRTSLVADLSPAIFLRTVNMNGYPVSISHEWRDDVSKVIIIEP